MTSPIVSESNSWGSLRATNLFLFPYLNLYRNGLLSRTIGFILMMTPLSLELLKPNWYVQYVFLLKFRILLIWFQWFPIIEFQFNPDIFFVPPHGFQVLIIRSHWYRFLLGHIFLFSNRLCRSNVPPSCFMNRCLPRIRNTKSRCIFLFHSLWSNKFY